jgi:hypothetical protein
VAASISGDSLQGGSSLATGKSLLRHAFWVFVAVVVVAFLMLAVIGEVGHLPKIDWTLTSGGSFRRSSRW